MKILNELIRSSDGGAYLHGDAGSFWKSDFTLGEVETYLFTIAPFPSDTVRAVKYPEAPFDIVARTSGEALKAFRDGYSLVLRSLHRRIPKIAGLAGAVGRALGCEVRVNAYVTPAGAIGFARHFDDHDVLIIQTCGRKKWQLFERISPIPMETALMSELQHALSKSFDVPLNDAALDERSIFEGTLAPGEFLFIPRGIAHEGHAQEQASIHLSLALIFPSRAEIAALEAFYSCMSKTEGRSRHRAGQRTLVTGKKVAATAALDSLIELKYQRERLPAPGSYLYSLNRQSELDVQTVVEWRPNIRPWLGLWAGRKAFVFHESILFIDQDNLRAWEFVAVTPRFPVCQLPLADINTKVEFAAELIRAGLLQLSLET